MDSKKKGIMARTLDLFTKRGIKSCTMGEICTFQRISKKTLYKFFRDKEDLVYNVVKHELEMADNAVQKIVEKGLNAIDESFEISKYVTDQMSDKSASMFWELEVYYPKAYKLYEDHQNECVKDSMVKNIQKGIDEGFYRKDINIDIVVSIYMTLMYNLLSAKLINTKNYSFSTLYRELFNYHTHGISSSKGREYLQLKLEQNENV